MEPLWSEQSRSPESRGSHQISDRVRAVAVPIVRALALDLVDVECLGQGGRMLLRVYIDKPGGVTVEDCEQVHLSLGHALDIEDPVPYAYTLEVSSPGLDRPFKRLEDYRRSLGKLVNFKLRQPVDGQWRVVGRLVDVNDQGASLSLPASEQGRAAQRASLSVGRSTVQIDWGRIAEARLEVEF
jgi:ribosome maturation factor RimP